MLEAEAAEAAEAAINALKEMTDEEFLKMYEKAAGTYGLGKKRRLLKILIEEQFIIRDLEERVSELQDELESRKVSYKALMTNFKELI